MAAGLRLRGALAKQRHRRIDLAALALIQNDPEHLPNVLESLKMVTLVPEHVDHFNDAPALQLFEAGADIGAGHTERFGDFLGVERSRGYVKEGMNLGNCTIDAPAGAHLAPMQHELLLDWRQCLHQFLLRQKYQKEPCLSRALR